VDDTVRYLCDFSDVLWKGPDDVGQRRDGADGRNAGSNIYRSSRVIVQDRAQLPLLNHPLYPAWSIAKQEMTRAQRKFECPIARDLQGAIETEELLFDRTARRIAVVRSVVVIGIAQGFAPRQRSGIREAFRQTPGKLELHGVIRGIPHIAQHR